MTTLHDTPTATSFLDGQSIEDTHRHDDQSDLQNALNELDRNFPGYQEAEMFYDGDVPEFFASVRLRRALTAAGEPYRINFAKKPVDLVTEKLKITAVTVPDNADANTALQKIWKDNQLAIEHKDMLLRAGEYGDANLIVWPAMDDDGNVVGVTMDYNNPACTRVFYDTENPRDKAFAVKKWVSRDRVRVNLYYPGRIEKYVSKAGRVHQIVATELDPYRDDDDGYDTEVDLAPSDEGDWPVNPFGEIPMFHLRNKNPYGAPEHRDFYGVQQILMKLIVGHMSTVDYASTPQRVALVDPDATGQADPEADDDGIIGFSNDDDLPSSREDPTSQLSADPGSVWWLQGVRDIKQFDTADPAGFLDPMLAYLRMGAQVSDMPVNRIDPTGAVQSGDSRRVAEAPFLSKVEDRQTRYGATFREAFVFALKILGFTDVDVVITWAPIQAVEDLQGWDVVRAKINAGMPPGEAFMQAGCTQEQVDAWFPFDADASLPERVELLLKLGQALQALGAASGFQLIPTETITGLVDALLGRLDEQAQQETGLEPPEPAAVPPAVVPARIPAGGGGDRTGRPE